MGGPEETPWLDLAASYEASVAREEEVAADDLAFSFRQGGDLRETLARGGWALLVGGEASGAVDEVGADFVAAGSVVVPVARAVLRSTAAPAPVASERTLAEVLGSACRAGAAVEVRAATGTAGGRVAAVGRDHVLLRARGGDSVVGLAALESVRLEQSGSGGYSASRGFSG